MRRPANPEAFRKKQRERETDRPLPPNVVSLDDFARAAPKKRKGLRSTTRGDVEQTLLQTARRREENDWKDAKPRHLVALYVQLHAHVYKVLPTELRGREWSAACLAAKRILDADFGGDVERMVSFVAWTWSREKKAYAKSDDPNRRRLGWRLQFSAPIVTDYRLYLAKQKEDRRTG